MALLDLWPDATCWDGAPGPSIFLLPPWGGRACAPLHGPIASNDGVTETVLQWFWARGPAPCGGRACAPLHGLITSNDGRRYQNEGVTNTVLQWFWAVRLLPVMADVIKIAA